ncbi:MAG: hypothetical protein C4519_00210 [Desulfobacteraceae bacterium]|nr:MAG: hypothetical protein C4519_00210 [Desulfobacteraceae bacterium]
MYFIANFQYLTDQQQENENERRHGNFSMMIQAESAEKALDRFRQRLVEFHRSSAFFEGGCVIFITQLLEFDQFPNTEAIMLNFRSYAGDPILPFISCVVPTEQSNACTIHEWKGKHPVTEGREDSLFIEFK